MFGGMISNVDPVTVYNIVKDISQGMEIDIRSGQVYLTTYSKEMWLLITSAGISSLLSSRSVILCSLIYGSCTGPTQRPIQIPIKCV